jgi:D-erythronate 2-dehydrogenase
VTSLLDWVPDPVVAGMVAGWAARYHSGRAAGLGLAADPDFVSIIRQHQAETRPA